MVVRIGDHYVETRDVVNVYERVNGDTVVYYINNEYQIVNETLDKAEKIIKEGILKCSKNIE